MFIEKLDEVLENLENEVALLVTESRERNELQKVYEDLLELRESMIAIE